jgi:O-succinylbenzoic acid--CoA ligase
MLLNGTAYTDIENINLSAVPDSDRKILEFCKGWLNKQPSFHIHTSGSTGKPKLISISREQMALSARMTGAALGLNENDHAFICLNTDYIAGMMMLARGFELKLKITVVPPVSNPLKEFPPVSKFSFAAFVPLQLQTILKDSPGCLSILNNMKAIIVGGAAVSPELEKNIQTILAPVYLTYGMTETVSHIALRRLNGPERSDFYAPLENVKLRLDQRGCLEINAPVTNHQWITTNDLAELHPDHKFKWLGRIDNIINSGGIKMQIEELESKIEKIFSSAGIERRFLISSLPHEELGESVVLILEGKKSAEEEKAVLEKLKAALQKFEVPKTVRFVEHFKMTETGKIDRKMNHDFQD